MTIGVLALQSDFDAHRRRLEQLGAEVALVKNLSSVTEILRQLSLAWFRAGVLGRSPHISM
jgi:glutamine amidotransferase PdxT